jgi:two-component system, chemotaxis family, chemotaxis protein CheY
LHAAVRQSGVSYRNIGHSSVDFFFYAREVIVDREPINILVIDDHEEMRNLLVEIIGPDHQTVAVGSAEEGLELLPIWTFQVAFVDKNLPGMDGLVLGEYLRLNNPDMTIALVTGEEDRSLVRKTKDLAIRFLAKPFDISEIRAVLDDYLEGAKERQAQRKNLHDPYFVPHIAPYASDLSSSFSIPKVPNRIEDRLIDTIKRCLNNLRSTSRYSERDRIVALSGLLALQVLGLDVPKTSGGRSLYEEYDALMLLHGRRLEFAPEAPPASVRSGKAS